MKESSWEDCIDSGNAIKISSDKPKVKSLIETAKARIDFLNKNEIKETTARFIFEGYYTSLLELLKALIITKEYKVQNHICIGYYLRDIMKREDLFLIFDDCRYKRNSIVYYGKDIEFETAKEIINKIIKLIKTIEKEINP